MRKAIIRWMCVALFILCSSMSTASNKELLACPATKLQAVYDIAQLQGRWVYVDFWRRGVDLAARHFPL